MQTTDPQDELFDIVDRHDRVIGKARRREVHRNKNLIHRSIDVAVFNKRGELFLQQRSVTKDTDPLKWTISCTGHVLSGDTYHSAAQRELCEELGITKIRLKFLDKYIVRNKEETEMTSFYKAKASGPFRLNLQEIKQGKFFGREQLMEEMKRGRLKVTLSAKVALEKLDWIL